MKKREEVMEILEAYDATGSLRGAATLVGGDHKTVARLVGRESRWLVGCPSEHAAGRWSIRSRPRSMSWSIAPARSCGLMWCTGVLVAMGYAGSYRTTRRAVAEAKRRWRNKHGRRTRPWIPQPGL